VHHIHAHRSFDGDGVALNGSDGIAERRIVPLHQQRHRRPPHTKTPAQRVWPILRIISLRLGPFINSIHSKARNITATLLYYRNMANPENGREEAPEAISPHYDIRLPNCPGTGACKFQLSPRRSLA